MKNLKKIITGVGLILANPIGEIAVVREKTSKPAVGKVAGMFTFPLETVEEGESPEKGTLKRLIREEIGVVTGMKKPRLMAFYSVMPGTVTIVYVARCEGATFRPMAWEEVEAYGWMDPAKLLTMESRRPEVEPVMLDYLHICCHGKRACGSAC